MARSEARILVEIWDDDDFLALSPNAQRLFMFLLSQRDLAHTGVLALRERRWARQASGLTVQSITDALTELAAARFVVVDEDAEELLIRSFIRRDKVYRQPNVLRAARDHLPLISSAIILDAVRVELRRIAEADDLGDKCAPILVEMLNILGDPPPNPPATLPETPAEPSREPLANPSGPEAAGEDPRGNPSRKATRGALGDRGVVTVVSTDSPIPEAPNPGGTAPLKGSGSACAREVPPGDHQPQSLTERLLAEHIAKRRRPPPARERARIAEQVHALVTDDPPFSPDEVHAVLDAWSARPLGAGAISSIADELFCRNGTVSALDRRRALPSGQPSGGTDANLSGHAALIAQLQAAEGSAL